MARFFIDHPVFAMVVAIVIVILGIATIPSLPIANFPEVVPPVVQISANYLGGNAQDLEKTVTEPIEEQLIGLDGLLYFLASSSNDGTLNIQVTFRLGTNPDMAVVQTQNRVSIAMPRLPPEVQRQGVTVKKVSTAFLTSVGLVSPDNRYDSLFLINYMQINLLNQIANLDGVGEARLSSNQVYSMRVWVNPDRMAELGVTATDVSAAIQAQNRQNPAGNFGQPPAPPGTDFQYSITAPGRLVETNQFEDVVLRARPDTSLLRIGDIGHVQLGPQNYSGFSRVNSMPAGNLIVYLSPGANAVATVDRIRKFMEEAKKNFPAGMDYIVPYDSTVFVHAAIHEVLITLLEAIGLVIIVVFIFLQNWRATLIPLLTVPVSIIGTFALFPALGFSINLTSMFGLVLAIGIVVDDAIVVVEAAQRHIDEGHAAAPGGHSRDGGGFGPGGGNCVHPGGGLRSYRICGRHQRPDLQSICVDNRHFRSLVCLQRAFTQPRAERDDPPSGKSRPRIVWTAFFRGSIKDSSWVRNRYLAGVHSLIRKSGFALLGLLCFWLFAGALFRHLPTGFLPDEDQGTILAAIRLPDGASVERADAATRKIEQIVSRIPGVAGTMTLGGTDITTRTNSSNVATLVIRLKHWDERQSDGLDLQSILKRIQAAFSNVPEGTVSAFGQPPIQGLSITGGFQLMLEDRLGGSLQDFSQVADLLVQAARKRPELNNVSSTFHGNVPSYSINVDLDKVQTLGIPVTSTYDTLQTFLGGLYVNDFNTFGRTWQVVVQAEPELRKEPADINRFYVRNSEGNMVPLGTVSTVDASAGPDVMFRYNRYRAIQILGGPAPGYSSGQASNVMEQVANSVLPTGYSYEWTGTTYQEKEAQGNEGLIFGFASVLVFLSLAALYESWAIPFAVLLALPLGLFGALFAAWVRSYPYDIYTQIGIVTLIGLAAKNAILIVEFARARHESGKSIHDAAMEAARLRLRPILMTSFAFILGVTPLLVAKGAGGASRRSLGTAVFGGMNAATLLAIFIVPVLYTVIQRIAESRRRKVAENEPVTELPE